MTWLAVLDAKCKVILSILAIIGTLASGIWLLDGRYVHADELVAQAQQWQKSLTDLKIGQLQSDRRGLQREQFELEQVRAKRHLTPLETTRYRAVLTEIDALDREIDVVRRRR